MENQSTPAQKKFLDTKSMVELQSQIQHQLAEGMKKEQIFDHLEKAYYDKQTLSRLVAQIPYPAMKQELKSLNRILVGILLASALLKFLIGIVLLGSLSLLAIPLAVFIPAITLWFAKQLTDFKGPIYRIAGFLLIGSLVRDLGSIVEKPPKGVLEASIVAFICVLTAGTSVLAFYLGRKLFPTLGIVGVKQSHNGKYLFD
jgi:hypothetical protein